jgi:hypothetical protein
MRAHPTKSKAGCDAAPEAGSETGTGRCLAGEATNNDLAGKAIQSPLIRLTGYVPTKGGRPHRLRARANPSDRGKQGRPKHGQALPGLRRYLVGLAKRSGGRRPWQEVDLNRVFNRFGYSLGWGRELFRRLTLDPFFRNLCKVRFVQKRLVPEDGHGNGCFVILLAFRPFLAWDGEPLFYFKDRETTRHLRPALRSEDLELFDQAAPWSKTKDCPVSRVAHYNDFSTYRTAEENNRLPAADSQCRFAEQTEKGCCFKENSLSETLPTLRISRNKPEPSPSKPTMQPATEKTNRLLRRKAVAVALAIKSDHWQGTETDQRNTRTVKFNFPHAYTFALEGLRQGHLDKTLALVWQQAVRQTHADLVDTTGKHRGPVKCPQALCLFHARRLLDSADTLSTFDRVTRFYRMRADQGRREAAKAERTAQVRVDVQKILAGDTKKTASELFAILKEGLETGALKKAVEGGK